MAGKKDFSSVNTSRIYETMAAATAEPEAAADPINGHKPYKERRTYTDDEARAAMIGLKTSGMKGVKLPRINLAFAPDVYDYIKVMSQVRGETLTEFVDHILRKNMEDNTEIYNKALEFRKSL